MLTTTLLGSAAASAEATAAKGRLETARCASLRRGQAHQSVKEVSELPKERCKGLVSSAAQLAAVPKGGQHSRGRKPLSGQASSQLTSYEMRRHL